MSQSKGVKVLRNMLSRCISLLSADPRVEGVYLVGSMADETMDEHSDIDLYIVVGDEHYEEVHRERFQLAQRIGDVLSTFEVEWPNCQMLGVIYRNYVEIDICYTNPGQAEVFNDRYKIALDKSGLLRKALKVKEYPRDPRSELKVQSEFALYNLLHAINMLRRGEYWSSIRQVETLRKRTVTLAELLWNKEIGEEYRKLETVLPTNVEKELRKSLCLYRKNEIKKSIVALTKLFCKIGEELAAKSKAEFPSEKFSHLLQRLKE